MKIIKQTIICIAIGLFFSALSTSENIVIEKFTEKIENAILKDYSVSEIKNTCLNVMQNLY